MMSSAQSLSSFTVSSQVWVADRGGGGGGGGGGERRPEDVDPLTPPPPPPPKTHFSDFVTCSW